MDAQMAAMLGTMPALFQLSAGGGGVCAPSSVLGAPADYNPWKGADEIIVDPDAPGGGKIFRPSQVTRDTMRRAVRSRTKSHQTLQDLRQSASATFMEVAEQTTTPIPAKPLVFAPIVYDANRGEGAQLQPVGELPLVPDVAPPVRPDPAPRDHAIPMKTAAAQPARAQPPVSLPHMPQAMPQPNPLPVTMQSPSQFSYNQEDFPNASVVPSPQALEMLHQPSFPAAPHAQIQHGSLNRQLTSRAAPAVTAAPSLAQQAQAPSGLPPITAPDRSVSFEVEGVPFTMQGWFHQVIRHGHTLVLVFDDRVRGYPRQFPPMTDGNLMLHVEGQPIMFAVQSSGHHFFLEVAPGLRYEIDILLIKQEHPYNPDVT